MTGWPDRVIDRRDVAINYRTVMGVKRQNKIVIMIKHEIMTEGSNDSQEQNGNDSQEYSTTTLCQINILVILNFPGP